MRNNKTMLGARFGSRFGSGCHSQRQNGHSLTEILLISSFAAMAVAAIPVIADYGSISLQTVSAAKLAAWQRNVWMPETSVISHAGVSGAITKTDAQLTNDLGRHIYRDKRNSPISIHEERFSELNGEAPQVAEGIKDYKVITSAENLPGFLNATDVAWDGVAKAQQVLSNTYFTRSLKGFTFVSDGLLRNEVQVSYSRPSFSLFPDIEFKEQVTMLTEAWNAGGTSREEAKIQGLVPMKLLDAPFYQQFRSTLTNVQQIVWAVMPAIDKANFTMGFVPGQAKEIAPLDRFELVKPEHASLADSVGDGTAIGASEKDKFRYYRAFPPTPVLSLLP